MGLCPRDEMVSEVGTGKGGQIRNGFKNSPQLIKKYFQRNSSFTDPSYSIDCQIVMIWGKYHAANNCTRR
jgi:hypothetical protein